MFVLPFGIAACSSDDNADISNAADSLVSEVSEAADAAVDSLVDDNADEGMARDLAMQVKAKLDAMASPGEPIITNINEATAGIVIDPNTVTGIDDTDNDGKDDDAKFTIQTGGGDDKACVQSQEGVWEVTDDEC